MLGVCGETSVLNRGAHSTRMKCSFPADRLFQLRSQADGLLWLPYATLSFPRLIVCPQFWVDTRRVRPANRLASLLTVSDDVVSPLLFISPRPGVSNALPGVCGVMACSPCKPRTAVSWVCDPCIICASCRVPRVNLQLVYRTSRTSAGTEGAEESQAQSDLCKETVNTCRSVFVSWRAYVCRWCGETSCWISICSHADTEGDILGDFPAETWKHKSLKSLNVILCNRSKAITWHFSLILR